MAIKNARYNVNNGAGYDTLHFETDCKQVKDKIVSLNSVNLVTEQGFLVDALAVKELIGKLNNKLSSTVSVINGITYERYENGQMKVYGRVTTSGQTAMVSVALSIPFKNTDYRILATPEYYSSNCQTFETSVQISTASAFNVYTRKSDGSVLGGVKVHVMLEGVWK